ncbi:uncharacterized protein LOC110723922 [Chenopodium quinoa]|uniref:uncharacterized protein LOC110723922 n=1 Tax=Chenopodium quinoa TaxID=63459 RepID=UPI000B7972BB|nr:uncharacterized protein LOC110723922 [Chenopodium quinoa]
MEGPSTTSNTHNHSHSHSNSRPVRASRYLYGNSSSSSASPATFRGPVRRWEKKWVHVSSSHSSTPSKPRKLFLSNGLKPSDAPLLLCKWTPLSRPPSAASETTATAADDGNSNSDQICRRKFRYTPITVFEEKKKKKLTAKGVADEAKSGETDQYAEKAVVDSEDIYGLLDINTDLMGVRQGTSDGDLIYTRRSHLNLGLHLENKNTQSGLQKRGLWALN